MASERSRFPRRWVAPLRPAPQPDTPPPSLPLLEYTRDLPATDWLRESVTTFAEDVASFLPGHFEAYARIHHPFGYGDPSAVPTTWRELSAVAGVVLHDPAAAMQFAQHGPHSAQARTGSLPRELIGPLVEHLRVATATPERCFFALWEGFGDSPVPEAIDPTLELPHRRYHLFTGPVEGAHTVLSSWEFGDQSANLWWPADRSWCVATEIDFAWTYVGAARSCIDALLTDTRLEALETTATSRW